MKKRKSIVNETLSQEPPQKKQKILSEPCNVNIEAALLDVAASTTSTEPEAQQDDEFDSQQYNLTPTHFFDCVASPTTTGRLSLSQLADDIFEAPVEVPLPSD